MLKFEKFENVVIDHIAIALFVDASVKTDVHIDRPYHGLVMNEPHGKRIYYFSDGREMRTEGGEVFYLPKGSSYRVKPYEMDHPDAGCYAINFSADIDHEPFTLKPRNPEYFKKLFAAAATQWKCGDRTSHLAVMTNLYSIILALGKESEKRYAPTSKNSIIEPAMKEIASNFNNGGLTVEYLASLCGISEVYFRKIFRDCYGISPKEYITEKRMEYARQLLCLGEFETSKVAELCGYAEPCHFSREFKKREGISPSKYR